MFVSFTSLTVTKSGFKHFAFGNTKARQSLHEAWLSTTIKSMFIITHNQLTWCAWIAHEMARLPLHLQLLSMFTFKGGFWKTQHLHTVRILNISHFLCPLRGRNLGCTLLYLRASWTHSSWMQEFGFRIDFIPYFGHTSWLDYSASTSF